MALTIEEPAPRSSGTSSTDIPLDAALSDTYVQRLVRGIRAARLNALFPPRQALCNHFGFLGQVGSHGLYDGLQISIANGLPTVREILRVKIDHDLAREFLADPRSPKQAPQGSRLARRILYYHALVRTQVMPWLRMSVALRKHDSSSNTALFKVVLDRFDLAGNQFVRYTILLTQRHAFWRRRHVMVDDADLSAPTEAFRRIVSRFVSHEAEVAFVLLSEVEGIEVEDVRRCRVGPLLLPGMKVGARLEALLGVASVGAAPPWALCFPEDRCGIDVSDNAAADPLSSLLRDAVGASARALYDAKADELGYRVAKTRKFVCSASLRGPLSSLCKELGAPSIVRAA